MAAYEVKKKKRPLRKLLEGRAREGAKKDALQAIAYAKKHRDRPTKKDIIELKRRDILIAQYMPFASSIASRVCQSLSSAVDYDEILCNARVGLLEAAKRFDAKQDVDFRTFAYYRIKGAIYDGLRRSGWLPRTLYQRMKFEEAANDYLQHKADGAQKDEILLTKTDQEIADTVNTIASIYIVSLETDDESDQLDETEAEVDIEKRAEFMEVRKYMREAVSSLPEKEKQLVMMYYFQNRTLEEIGDKLQLSKSWTSRLHARALGLMFKRIKGIAKQHQDGTNEVVADALDPERS